ncbi:MAG: biotin--[acetyl-CoA-carboxylase] ligase [Prevotella sp.]|nr:biotin--[acetyl-CoA-carboxylase] ligase [Prevotella sp.]
MIKTVHLTETDSTNSWLKANGSDSDMVVWADFQTAGRGCGENTWESEDGKNLLFSMLYHPHEMPASEQFIISMANALALRDALSHYSDDITIKWPNDIYWRDKKICGTLIETSLQGGLIKHCIIGTGLNVNQPVFRSNAPNPVSLCHILGREVSREEVMEHVLACTEQQLERLAHGDWEAIRNGYRQHLYRQGESHDFLMEGRRVTCRLIGVTDDGHLQLLPEGMEEEQPRLFAFKEVSFII